MRKRLISFLLTLCLIAGLLPATTLAASTSDLTFTLNSYAQTYSVTNCDESASGALTIPATYNGKPVTSIGDSAFYNCTSLTSITIPDSVTSIGDSAFYNCTSLTRVTIPDSVTGIGKYAFRSCSNLTNITISDSVTYIAYGAFWYCTSLTSITIPDNVRIIGEDAFRSCTSLTSVTIPDSVTSIGRSAFSSCKSLTSATIGNGVTSIGDYAFRDCTSLTGIWVSENNPAYSSDSRGVLFNKNQTTLVAVPGGIAGSYMIPSSVTSIGTYAFEDCSSLTSITIPDSVTSIESSAFSDCSSLTGITIPDSVTSVGAYAFYGCYNLQFNIYDNAKYLGNSANPYRYLIESANDSITSCYIHNATKVISGGAFSDCTSLTSITIPDSVTSIGRLVFNDCTSLTGITISDSVTYIAGYAFQYCTSLADVYYEGTEEQWAQIRIDSGNDYLRRATIHYGDPCDKGHSYEATSTVEPTCTTDGSTTYTCSVCGDSYVEDVAATGHSYSAAWTKKPTCAAAGELTYTCDYCSDSYVVEVPAVGHIPGAAATCTTAQTCTTCGATIKVATGHSYVAEITAPTCTTAGYTTHTCSVCGDSYVDSYVAAAGHQADANDPTHCAACGVTLTTYISGDVNSDGVVNLKDATILSRYVAGWPGIEADLAAADVNGDGAVNLKDVTILRRYVAGWEGTVLQ